MPSKIQLDENLWFLYICLQNSDMKSIDYTAVGLATSLKPPAARMRYTRLKRQIESGTLVGRDGRLFCSSQNPSNLSSSYKPSPLQSKKVTEHNPLTGRGVEREAVGRKRKRAGTGHEHTLGFKWDLAGSCKGKGGGEEEEIQREAESVEHGREKGIKEEEVEESIWDSSESEEWDSEDEVPLAKLLKARLPTPDPRLHASFGQQAQYGEIDRVGVGYGMIGAGGSGMDGVSRGGWSERRHGEVEGEVEVPHAEGRAWMGMIPGGSAGVSYPAYWSGFPGIGAGAGAQELGLHVQSQEPRKSV